MSLISETGRRKMVAGQFLRFCAVACIGALVLPFVNCGGGGESAPPVTPNPVPSLSSLTPATAPAGSRALTLTVYGLNFISGSVVQWRGSSRTTTYVSSSQLTASITPDDLAAAGQAAVTVFNPAPGGGTSATMYFTVATVDPLSFLTTRLPDAQHSKAYDYTLEGSGGLQPYSWSVASGSLPSGLTLSSTGRISGTPPAVTEDTTVSFSVQLSDYAYRANTLAQPFSIQVRANSLGRNDTCDTATPISNGIIRASISPYGDIDVYSFHGTTGKSVSVEIYAQRLSVRSYLDSFLEILNSNCERITYNDDISAGINVDSLISNYLLPYTGTYYIRVSDLRGDGRPDLIYELHLSGAD